MTTCLYGCRARMWLFSIKYLQSERGRLSFNVIREICGYLSDLLLPQVTSTFLCFFNCCTYAREPQIILSTPIQADHGSTWVLLEDGGLFCSGGTNYMGRIPSKTWNSAYLLNRNGGVEELPSMLTAIPRSHSSHASLHLWRKDRTLSRSHPPLYASSQEMREV